MYALPFILLHRLHQAAIKARRNDRTWHYFAWSALAGAVASVLIAIGLSFGALLWLGGLWWLALVLGGVIVAPLTAMSLARHVLVPLGWYRLAYWSGIVSRPGKDEPAFALCVAAWAHAIAPTAEGERWLAVRRDARLPLGDSEVVVAGLIAAGKGDTETARHLMQSVSMMVELHPAVRELVGEWLACDAAERGAWRELYDDAIAARWPASPLTYFLEGAAAREIAAAGAPERFELWARWILAPHRRTTRAIYRAALRPLPSDSAVDAPAAPTPLAPEVIAAERGALPHAVAAHLAFGHSTPTAAGLASCVRAWDAALADGPTHGWLAHRARELDAPLGAVDRALREVAVRVTAELGGIAETARLGAPTSQGPVGVALARRLRHGRLDALESAFSSWQQRRHDGATRIAIDEWREFIALHAAYHATVSAGGLDLRRLAFPHAFTKGCSMAAWLWNSRKEYALSHAISKWLLAEALIVGDTEAIELGHRNCELDVPTRLGKIR